METLSHLLLWLAVLTGALVLAGVLAVRWAVRRIRRAVGSGVARLLESPGQDRTAARPAVARARLLANLPGQGRDVAVVRRDLITDVIGAQRAVAVGRDAGRPVHGLDSIVRRLSEQARALDVDLRVVAAEPDRGLRRRLLAGQAERVALLRHACGQVRQGVLLAGSATTAPLLGPLVEELDEELLALGLRAHAYRELVGL